MASPIDATTVQRLRAAKEEFDQQYEVITHRLADKRFRLQDESAEALRETAHNARTAAHRLAELANIIGQDAFSLGDDEHLRHVIDELSEPNEDLDGAVNGLRAPQITGQYNQSDGFDIWRAEWDLAITRFRHAADGVLMYGRVIALLLARLS